MRHLKDFVRGISLSKEKRIRIARKKEEDNLPIVIYKHKSLIRRKLGNVRMDLQENKAVNLSIAAPLVTNILIQPGETFSFWNLVGKPSSKKGYLDGLTIANGDTREGLGGGMCQFTNLIHWMVLHTPMEIVEHHHHDGLDLFPDFNRQIPFGTGTSIVYNYLDYRFRNTTENIYQLITYVTDEYLCGEMRALNKQKNTYHISSENEHFIRENGEVYRVGEVYRSVVDVTTGKTIEKMKIRSNHAKVMYDSSDLTIIEE